MKVSRGRTYVISELTVDANIAMAAHRLTGLSNGVDDADSARVDQILAAMATGVDAEATAREEADAAHEEAETGVHGVGLSSVCSETEADAKGEGHITILPLSYEAIGAGTWVVTEPVAGELVGSLHNDPKNDLDNLSYEVYLAAGTYTILLVAQKDTLSGIVDIDIEGVEVASFDTYAAVLEKSVLFEDAGNVIATAGIKTITLRLDGKNGASGSFELQFNYLVLWRTA